jgi:hypothetical protein
MNPNGTWVDAGLAEKLIAVLEKCQMRNFLSFDLLLSAFLLHDRQDAVVRHLFKVNITDDESAKPYLGLVWHHCEMCQIGSTLIASLVANLHPDYHVKYFPNVEFDGEFAAKSERVYMAIRKYLFSSPIQVDAEYVKFTSDEDPQDRHRKNERDWQQLWRRLSIDPAPWSVNLESEPRFTRDFVLCAYECPFKVKRNWRLEHRCSSPSPALSEGDELIEVIDDRILSFPCNILKILKSKPATFLLFDEWIELKIREEPGDVSTSRRSDRQIEAKEGKVIKIRFSDIINILFRQVSGKPSSIEIFTILGRAFLIQFVSHNPLTILKRLALLKLPHVVDVQTVPFAPFFKQHNLTPQWMRGKISSFGYLMHLNLMSGRTFNDIAQYPVFPCVLSDFTSQTLDLSQRSVFRDLDSDPDVGGPDLAFLSKLDPFTSVSWDDYVPFQSTRQLKHTAVVVPELYFSPEFLRAVDLPPWSSNCADFIYRMRKALESDFVSSHLNNWVDCVWGAKRQGSKFVELFQRPHPDRQLPKISSNAAPYIIPVERIQQISLARVEYLDAMTYKVTIVDTSGAIVAIIADFTPRRLLSTGNIGSSRSIAGVGLGSSFKEMKEFLEELKEIDSNRNCVSHLDNSRIAIVSSNRLMILDLNKLVINTVMTNVSGISSSGQFIAISETNASVSIYRDENFSKKVLMMPSYSDSVSCCCVNQTFLIVVIGTRDGSLIINSLVTGATVRVTSLDGARPYLISITNGWGFVATYARRVEQGKVEHFIFVFNVNGELLRRQPIDFQVTTWSCWTNAKGFDYMVMSDENGKLFVFEVFFCEIGEGIFRCRSPVQWLTYALDIGCVVAVTRDGKLIFVPHQVSG